MIECGSVFITKVNAPVAQLDRVVAFEAIGCTFESCQAHHHAKGPICEDAPFFV